MSCYFYFATEEDIKLLTKFFDADEQSVGPLIPQHLNWNDNKGKFINETHVDRNQGMLISSDRKWNIGHSANYLTNSKIYKIVSIS